MLTLFTRGVNMTATYTMTSLCSWRQQMSAERCISTLLSDSRSFEKYKGVLAPTDDVTSFSPAGMLTASKTLYFVEVSHTEADEKESAVLDKISELLYNSKTLSDEAYHFDSVLKYKVKIGFRDYSNENNIDTEVDTIEGWGFLHDELVSRIARCIYDHHEVKEAEKANA